MKINISEDNFCLRLATDAEARIIYTFLKEAIHIPHCYSKHTQQKITLLLKN